MGHRCRVALPLAVLTAWLLAGCSSVPNYRPIGEPIRGLSSARVLDSAELILARHFKIEKRDDQARTLLSRPVIENVVPGSRLDRYRRRAYLKVESEKDAIQIHIHVTLQRAMSETPIFYAGPWEPNWKDLGRDSNLEDRIGNQIQELLEIEMKNIKPEPTSQ